MAVISVDFAGTGSSESMAKDALERLPVHLVTGMLGAGKTTFLRKMLASTEANNALFLVSEAAPLGVDQITLSGSSDSDGSLIGGCICCAGVDSVVQTLHDLCRHAAKADHGSIVIETSGISDVGKLIFELERDPRFVSRYRLGTIVTLVDCVNVSSQCNLGEWKSQVELADTIVLSRLDTLRYSDRAEAQRKISCLLRDHARGDAIIVDQQTASDFRAIIGERAQPQKNVREIGARRASVTEAHDRLRATQIRLPRISATLADCVGFCQALACMAPKLVRLKGIVPMRGSPNRFILFQIVMGRPQKFEALDLTGPDDEGRIYVIDQDIGKYQLLPLVRLFFGDQAVFEESFSLRAGRD